MTNSGWEKAAQDRIWIFREDRMVTEYADQRAHEVMWMTAEERDQLVGPFSWPTLTFEDMSAGGEVT